MSREVIDLIPILLIQIALVVIIVRCVYRAIKLGQGTRSDWLEIIYLISFALIALWLLLKT